MSKRNNKKSILYHISRDGTVGICKANIKTCPLGGHSLNQDELQNAIDSANFAIDFAKQTKKEYEKDENGNFVVDRFNDRKILKGSHLEELFKKPVKDEKAYLNNKIMTQKNKSEKFFEVTLKKIIHNDFKDVSGFIKQLKYDWSNIVRANYYEKTLLEERLGAENFIKKFDNLIIDKSYAETSPSVYISIHKSSLPLIYDYLKENFKDGIHEETGLPQLIYKNEINNTSDNTRYNDLIVIRFSNHIPKPLLENTTFVETPEEYKKMTKEEKIEFNKKAIFKKTNKKGLSKRKFTKEQFMERLEEEILILSNRKELMELPFNAPEYSLKNSKEFYEDSLKKIQKEKIEKRFENFKNNNPKIQDKVLKEKFKKIQKEVERDFEKYSFENFINILDEIP